MPRVKDFRPASRNANKHTARGMSELQKSVQSNGWIGAMTTAADGEMIAGSARIETAAQVFGVDAEPIVVETDGRRPIIVKRTDIATADDPRAQALALSDNRVAELDLSWDVEVLAGLDADVLEGLWEPEELEQMYDASLQDASGAENSARGLGAPTLIRLVVDVSDVGAVERALAETGENNRGEALLTICRSYLDAKR